MEALKKRGGGGARISKQNNDVYIYIVAGFFYFYLLFISHCPLLFSNNIAIHHKKLYANPSQQLRTIKTN